MDELCRKLNGIFHVDKHLRVKGKCVCMFIEFCCGKYPLCPRYITLFVCANTLAMCVCMHVCMYVCVHWSYRHNFILLLSLKSSIKLNGIVSAHMHIVAHRRAHFKFVPKTLTKTLPFNGK